MTFTKYLLSLLVVFALISCGKNYSPEEKNYIDEIENMRKETNEYMRDNASSPFNKKGKVEFHNLKYYDVDPAFAFTSKLFENEIKDTITVYGTKGDARETVKYGYLQINFKDKNYKINLYESDGGENNKYYSIWFTDKTTNKSTYGVGRYVNFEKNDDPNYLYTIDFNKAYNPYCAYTSTYSCAIPTKEDYIDFAIEAGEKKFHD